MKAIILLLVAATSALAAPRTANLHLLYGGDDRANQNWSTLDSTIGRLSLFLGSPTGVGTTTLFTTANHWDAQQRFDGANGGIDVDADQITSNGIGVVVESGVPSPLTGPAPAFFWAYSGKAANTVSPSIIAQTATSSVVTDGVIGFRRSSGSFGAETAQQAATGAVMGTLLMQTWKTGLGYNATYDTVWSKECYPGQNHAPTTEGVSCKEYAMPNGSGGAAGLKVVDYIDTSGNRQLPFGLIVGGGTNALSPTANLQVYNTAGVASPAANEVVQVESPGLAATKSPRVQWYQGKLARTDATKTAIVTFNSNTGTNSAAGVANAGQDNVYMVTASVTGLCTVTSGGVCTAGQGGAWKKTTMCVNTGGTLTCGGTVATTDDFSADNFTTHLTAPISIEVSTETIQVNITSLASGTVSYAATVEITSGRI